MPMIHLLRTLFNDEPGGTKAKIVAIYAVLLAGNLGAWIWALAAFHRFPVILGTAFLAYSFGLRHAVDADHIAAIDNVTRKLMQQGKRPVTVGLMFSLGHRLRSRARPLRCNIASTTSEQLEGSSAPWCRAFSCSRLESSI
jgi:high-affinity nickel permease